MSSTMSNKMLLHLHEDSPLTLKHKDDIASKFLGVMLAKISLVNPNGSDHWESLKAALLEEGRYIPLHVELEVDLLHPHMGEILMEGKILELLQVYCSNETKVMAEFKFNSIQREDTKEEVAVFNEAFETGEMPIWSPSNYGNIEHWGKSEQIIERSKTDVFCHKGCLPLPPNFIDTYKQLKATTPTCDFELIATLNVYVILELKFLYDDKMGTTSKNMGQEILAKKLESDVSIISSSGHRLNCHKSILSVNSRVLATYFANPDTVHMNDVSEEGVTALKSFFYTRGTTLAFSNSKVAVELFKTAFKYEIEPLKQTLANELLLQRPAWYDTNSAVELFCFVRTVDAFKDLKIKACRVLKAKANNNMIMELDAMRKMIREDFEASLEFSLMAAKDNP